MTIHEAWDIVSKMIDRTYTNQDYDDAINVIEQFVKKYAPAERKTLYIGEDIRCNSCKHWLSLTKSCAILPGTHEIGCGLWQYK